VSERTLQEQTIKLGPHFRTVQIFMSDSRHQRRGSLPVAQELCQPGTIDRRGCREHSGGGQNDDLGSTAQEVQCSLSAGTIRVAPGIERRSSLGLSSLVERACGESPSRVSDSLISSRSGRRRFSTMRAGAPCLAQGPRGGGKANQLLHLSRNLDELRGLPCLARPPPSPRHLHDPAQSPLCPKKRMREREPRDRELLELLLLWKGSSPRAVLLLPSISAMRVPAGRADPRSCRRGIERLRSGGDIAEMTWRDRLVQAIETCGWVEAKAARARSDGAPDRLCCAEKTRRRCQTLPTIVSHLRQYVEGATRQMLLARYR
jgi:hypothetical protein